MRLTGKKKKNDHLSQDLARWVTLMTLIKALLVQWGGKSLTGILEISSSDNTFKDFFL